MKKKYTFKKFLADFHLWLGILSGLVLFLVCLSGTLLTFQQEIQELLEPEKYYINIRNQGPKITLDSLRAKLESRTGLLLNSMIIRENPDKTYMINLKKQGASRRDRGQNFHVNPYTGEIISDYSGNVAGSIHLLEEFHRYLLMGKTGKIIVGVSTIIFILLSITGLVLWWPKNKKQLKNALKVKISSSWKRINYDLHNVLGFYSLIPILIMAFSGLNWSFEWYRKGMSTVLNDDVFKVRFEGPIPLENNTDNSKYISFDSILKKSETILNFDGAYRISFPSDSNSSILIRKKSEAFFALDAPDKVHVNPYSGKIIRIERLADLTMVNK